MPARLQSLAVVLPRVLWPSVFFSRTTVLECNDGVVVDRKRNLVYLDTIACRA